VVGVSIIDDWFVRSCLLVVFVRSLDDVDNNVCVCVVCVKKGGKGEERKNGCGNKVKRKVKRKVREDKK